MRRIFAAVALLAATLLVPSTATARGLTDVVSKRGLPADVQAVRMSCSPGAPNPPVLSPTTSAFQHVHGVLHPPLGTGSLRIDAVANTLSGIRVSREVSLARLSALSVQAEAADVGDLFAFLYLRAGGHQWVLIGPADGSPSTWVNYHLFDVQPWFWQDLTTDNGPSYPFGTISEFVAAHTPSPGFKIELIDGGTCGRHTNGPVFFDDLELAIDGVTKRYNFEATTTGLTIAANRSRIARGSAVRVSTVFTDGGTPVPHQPVSLWARRSGATVFTKIKTITSALHGRASTSLTPRTRTTYQWRFAGGRRIEPSRSPKKTVHVTR